jgi:hypothetical protein
MEQTSASFECALQDPTGATVQLSVVLSESARRGRIRLGIREVAIEGIEKTINPIINERGISGRVDLLVTAISVGVSSQYESKMGVWAATAGFAESEDFSVDAESWARFRSWVEQLQVPTSS